MLDLNADNNENNNHREEEIDHATSDMPNDDHSDHLSLNPDSISPPPRGREDPVVPTVILPSAMRPSTSSSSIGRNHNPHGQYEDMHQTGLTNRDLQRVLMEASFSTTMQGDEEEDFSGNEENDDRYEYFRRLDQLRRPSPEHHQSHKNNNAVVSTTTTTEDPRPFPRSIMRRRAGSNQQQSRSSTTSSNLLMIIPSDLEDEDSTRGGSGSGGEGRSASGGILAKPFFLRPHQHAPSSHGATKEQRLLWWWRPGQHATHSPLCKRLVLAFCLAAAVAMTTYTYLHFHSLEETMLQQEWNRQAYGYLKLAENQVSHLRSSLQALSMSYSLTALNGNMKWPEVTMVDFDQRAQSIMDQCALTNAPPPRSPKTWLSPATPLESVVRAVAFAPIVNVDESASFEQYATSTTNLNGTTGITSDGTAPTVGQLDSTSNLSIHPVVANATFQVPIWQATTSSIGMLQDLNAQTWFGAIAAQYTAGKYTTMPTGAWSPLLQPSAQHSDALWMDAMPFSNQQTVVGHNSTSWMIQPVLVSAGTAYTVVGFVLAVVDWSALWARTLLEQQGQMDGWVSLTDGDSALYLMVRDGNLVSQIGHDSATSLSHSKMVVSAALEEASNQSPSYTFTLYASKDFQGDYTSNQPMMFAILAGSIFILTGLLFILYDFFVQRLERKVLSTAQRSTAIVASIFPKDVQRRLLDDLENTNHNSEHFGSREVTANNGGESRGNPAAPRSQLQDFLGDRTRQQLNPLHMGQSIKGKPIADLFTEVTVMFADIVGFTAWSSMRQPTQVFILLESIFHEFDEIARRRRVFKVETVGDCYVAVAGLPDPRKDHALVMARYAFDCLRRVVKLFDKLEVALGPDTADLGVRFGLHSGPVIAGVLRGERARFQLFGDTMNTTARIESTGKRNKIHISQETADLLIQGNKGHWIRQRDDKVVAKGKGEMTTFWLEPWKRSANSVYSGYGSDSASTLDIGSQSDPIEMHPEEVDGSHHEPGPKLANQIVAVPKNGADKMERLIDWNTQILTRLLKDIVARRESVAHESGSIDELNKLERESLSKNGIVFDEQKEIISLPKFNRDAAQSQASADCIELPAQVESQFRAFIQALASMYRDNPFHNFEHASHVTMSVVKLLSRIVAPDIELSNEKDLHDHTYGITSDPLTQFAVVLSALIHDVDHSGVPNSQLIKEQAEIAAAYKNKSVAEQNSVDLAWKLLMQDAFFDLRRVIYTSASEFKRFRQLLVNAVLATDIMDKDLSMLRKERWNKAFADGLSEQAVDGINRRATIVIEHLIQASDVAHTMQHWHVYRKWNTRLFEEMYGAYQEGRAEKDPSLTWYESELGFFDHYIIPLATKVKTCGVFGVCSDEYLNYAIQNRQEWERRGPEVIEELLEHVKGKGDN